MRYRWGWRASLSWAGISAMRRSCPAAQAWLLLSWAGSGWRAAGESRVLPSSVLSAHMERGSIRDDALSEPACGAFRATGRRTPRFGRWRREAPIGPREGKRVHSAGNRSSVETHSVSLRVIWPARSSAPEVPPENSRWCQPPEYPCKHHARPRQGPRCGENCAQQAGLRSTVRVRRYRLPAKLHPLF